jgi:hypothetical protein
MPYTNINLSVFIIFKNITFVSYHVCLLSNALSFRSEACFKGQDAPWRLSTGMVTGKWPFCHHCKLMYEDSVSQSAGLVPGRPG